MVKFVAKKCGAKLVEGRDLKSAMEQRKLLRGVGCSLIFPRIGRMR